MDTRVVLKPYERFGLTEEEFKNLLQKHKKLSGSEPQVKSCEDSPLYDWEAGALARVFEVFPDDVPVRSLLAAMMLLVQTDVRRRHDEIKKAEKNKGKPLRANTIGMFFAPPEEKVPA